MNKIDRAKFAKKELDKAFPNPPIPLDHDSVFTLLIAVLLSAQCTDKRVNQVTPELFSLADNPEEMSKLRVDQIRKIIRPCGLSPKKSKAIKELSKILLSEHKGQVPEDFESLEISTEASVCPARISTPPFFATIGKTCPGDTKSLLDTFLPIATFIVLARSCADIPVVIPFLESIDTVKAVFNLALLVDDISQKEFVLEQHPSKQL